jgi:hypothetical protein
MSKQQTMLWLFILLILIFSMDMIFGNPIRETFKGIGIAGGRDVKTGSIGAEYIPSRNVTNSGFLASKIPANYKIKSDDQPLYFGFSF